MPSVPAAQHVHQHRLGLVVHVVRERDKFRARLDPRLLQKSVAEPSRGGLDPLAGRAKPRNVRGTLIVRDAEPRAEPAAKRGVFEALGPADAVLKVRGGHIGARLAHQAQQRDGVRTARKRDEHLPARPAPHPFEDIHSAMSSISSAETCASASM